MDQIADWLKSLGMPEYAQRFADNAIDFSVLPDLTDQDLEKIGVLLGHRRKILKAIAGLNSSTPAQGDAAKAIELTAPSPTRALPIDTSGATGERRYLTVMFCDLVGSTGISAQLDAEEWRDLVSSYLDAASAAVADLGGHVAKKLGDGILALFGYPVAHENDAERAARAALAIQRALAELNRKNAGSGKPELKARIGLETGPAVVDAAGELYGDVVNVAARVQAVAEPNTILMTAQVQRQIAGLFVAEERGAHPLKGVSEPVALFRLVRASGGGRRVGQRNLTPLVGRDDEMAMLIRRWEQARGGDGQLVLIVGEPGLGKSRLIEEFHPRLSDTPHTWVEWSCSQLLQNTPLHPIAEWGRQRFGGADVPAEHRLADLESSLAQVKLDAAEMAPLLAPLVDIPLPTERVPAFSGEELRRRQLAALTNWVMAGAKVQPVVLAFEDLHWADPTTLDVLRGIAEQGALAPLFIIATTRPEFRPPWSTRSHHGTISLAPLDRSQVRDMVAELAARHALPGDVIDGVAARTGGVPLFVEEVTRLLLERGEQGGIQAIPPTLQQSLMARLDRLGPAREVAQVGSVIGRGFSYKLLRDVAAMEDVPLQASLEKLADADIVLVQGTPPESDYRFKHALIQDAAYENLLKSRRQVLHRRVAETLRDRFADTAAAEPEVLAHHFTQAGMTDTAIEWWGKAGDQALRRSAFQEAIAHLGKAIEMADKEGDAASRAVPAVPVGQRLKLQTDYGRAVMWSRGFAADETKAAFIRARELAAGIGNTEKRFDTYYGLWLGSAGRAEMALARELAETFRREADNAGRMMETAVARRFLGITCFWQGDFIGARAYCEEALRIYDAARDREAKNRFGVDTAIGATCYLALVSWPLGDVARARQLIEDAVARAIASADVVTLLNGYGWKARIEVLRDDVKASLSASEALVELCRKNSVPNFLNVGLGWSGWALARLGDRTVGVKRLREAITAATAEGTRVGLPSLKGLLAELEADGGDEEGALARIDDALALAGETGEVCDNAQLHRIRGQILLRRDPANTTPPEEAFRTAIAVAQQQKAKSFELRAALSLAKLYQSTNRALDAHAVLAPALEGFSPTLEFPEIAEAQALLAELADTDEAKNAATARQRRLKLQTSYGQALTWGKGYAAPETAAAFARAHELGKNAGDATAKFETYYSQQAGRFMRGELALARESATAFLREAESAGRMPEIAAAHRVLGLTLFNLGDFVDARSHFVDALRTYDPQWDRETKIHLALDTGACARAYLARVNWVLGEVAQTGDLMDDALARAVELGHIPTLVNTHYFRALFEQDRDNIDGALQHAERVLQVARQHELATYPALGSMSRGYARARLGERDAGIAELRDGLASYIEQGNNNSVPYYQALLARLEAENGGGEGALARVDEALALAAETGEHRADALLHRIRGEVLLKRDQMDTAPAEEAFLTAIAVAQQQKAKSFELQGALPLANLYQLTGRNADAHAVLAVALEGFSATPEFPEIAEAQTLLATLQS